MRENNKKDYVRCILFCLPPALRGEQIMFNCSNSFPNRYEVPHAPRVDIELWSIWFVFRKEKNYKLPDDNLKKSSRNTVDDCVKEV